MGKRETAWSTGTWADFNFGGSNASALKEEIEEELAHWCVGAMDRYHYGGVFIDGEEYTAYVTVKLKRVK